MSLATKQYHAVEFNNLGASYIESGDLKAAIKSLSNALKAARDILADVEGNRMAERAMLEQNLKVENWMAPSSLIEADYTQSIDSDCWEGGLIYRRTMKIQAPYCDCRSTIPLAIVFNLALAHHLNAMEQESDEILMRKSKKIYEHVFDVYRKLHGPSSGLLIIMATLNNVGQIHRKLNEKEQSQNYFEQLLSTVMILVDCKEGNPADLEFFFGNVHADTQTLLASAA